MKLLRALPIPPVIDDRVAADPLLLAEVVFGCGDQLDYDVFLRAVHQLVIDEVEIRTKVKLLQDFYFLDPLYVADTAVGRLVAEWCIHFKVRPLAEWIPDVLDRTAIDCRTDPEAQLHFRRRDASSRDKMAYDIERFLNLQDRRSRQLAWMLFLDKKSMRQISLETTIPFEHVEAFFVELGNRSLSFSQSEDASDRMDSSSDRESEPDENESEEGDDG